MRSVQALLVASVIAGIKGFEIPGIGGVSLPLFKRAAQGSQQGGSSCPAIWSTIAGDLQNMFVDTQSNQCNDDARAAIRMAFHDCATWDFSQGNSGGCDGSIILAPGEIDRSENSVMAGTAGKLHALQQQYASSNVGVADMIQFAGAVAIVSCPGGPRIQTYVGRPDSSNLAPPNLLPDTFAPAETTLTLFENKGFNARELAALIGAHSTAKQFVTDPQFSGEPQDSTPGIWDVQYYQNTLSPAEGTYVLPGDLALANDPNVGPQFHSFINNQFAWGAAFSQAMTHMSLLGISGGASSLTDCTSAVPGGSPPHLVRKGFASRPKR